jgi:hypothetical protein
VSFVAVEPRTRLRIAPLPLLSIVIDSQFIRAAARAISGATSPNFTPHAPDLFERLVIQRAAVSLHVFFDRLTCHFFPLRHLNYGLVSNVAIIEAAKDRLLVTSDDT